MRERKGRKAVQGERSSRRLSCDHRGVPSPEKEPPMIRESEKERRRERERKVLAGEREIKSERQRTREEVRGRSGNERPRERDRRDEKRRRGRESEKRGTMGSWTLPRPFCTNTPRRSVSQRSSCPPPVRYHEEVCCRSPARARSPPQRDRRENLSLGRREDTARSLSAASRVLIVLLVARCESRPATTGRRRT